MNAFKRKSMYAAVLAGLGVMGAAGTASAVHVNPDGLGEVLIYPYYTVRDGNDTYLSVVNTTASTKAVKVRFLEGKNSKEVLDFNLYLSPYDVWTGAVVATADGAKLVTADKSCTTPAIPAAGQPFVNYQFISTNADGEIQTLDRTREGYFELIEMGELTDAVQAGYAKHSNGTPANCGALQTLTVGVSAPNGGLSGTASLVNPASGTDYGYDAVAIDQWSDTPEWTVPGSTLPSLASGSVYISNVFTNGGAIPEDWTTSGQPGANAVSATLMHNNLVNEFVLDSTTLSGTDWVVTFPTKNMYVGKDTLTAGVRDHSLADYPFNENFGLGGACDGVTLTIHDREEASAGVSFSPLPPDAVTTMCWESNVVTFNNSNILGSSNSMNVGTTHQNGWLNMAFTDTYAYMTAPDGTTYYGLPAVGFMVQDFINQNAAPGVMATYGGNFNHKGTRNIVNPL